MFAKILTKTILSFFLVLFFANGAFCQRDTALKNRDSATRRLQFTETLQGSLADSLLVRLEEMQNTLNNINILMAHGLNTRNIEEQLPKVQSNLKVIKENISDYSTVLSIRNLQTFKVLLQDMQEQLEDWRNTLLTYDKSVVKMNADMYDLVKDSFIRKVREDSTLVSLYSEQMNGLRDKFRKARKATTDNYNRLNKLQALVANSYFTSVELQSLLDSQIMVTGRRSFGKEYNYLWETNKDAAANKLLAPSQKSYDGQRQILDYYFNKNGSNWYWLLFISLLFGAWIFRSFYRIKKAEQLHRLSIYPLRYVRPIAIVSSLVVAFNVVPFFDINPPAAYVVIMQALLLVLLTILFARTLPRRLMPFWITIFVLYFCFGFMNVSITTTFALRMFLLLLNVAALAFGRLFYRHIPEMVAHPRMIKVITTIFLILNALAIFCNLFGRLTLAKAFSTSAIYGLTQMMGLVVFVRIVTEVFFLQMLSSRIKQGVSATFNFENVEASLQRMLTVVIVVLWLIVFATNLNVYNGLYNAFTQFFYAPRTIGSTTFTVSNVVLFFFILYISNLLQKYSGYFFGETEEDLLGEIDRKSSRLVMLRLVVLVAGFLLAVSASGLPVDKITIVLGALGVGIGLGLQTIVNNLVSGIILIFERPLRIGDYIEIGGKKGRIRDIGIRASKMMTDEGSEIIVPNGDLLSQSITNWTLSNNHIRLDLLFKVAGDTDVEAASQYITEALMASEFVLQKREISIFTNAVSKDAIKLKVSFWCSDIYKTERVKSNVRVSIYKTLVSHNIETS